MLSRLVSVAVLLLTTVSISCAEELLLLSGKKLPYKSLSLRKEKIYVTMPYGAKMVSWAEIDPKSLPGDIVAKVETYVRNTYTYANNQYEAGEYEKAMYAYRFVGFHYRYLPREEYKTMLDSGLQKRAQGMYQLDGEWTSVQKQKAIFEKAQKKKGLVKWGNQWMTPAERDLCQAKKAVADLIRQRTKRNMHYELFQALEEGSLCAFPIPGQDLEQPYVGDVFYLAGATQDLHADGEKYRGDLFWAGTHTYTTVKDITKTIACYATDYATAYKRATQKLGVTTNSGE